MQPVDRSFVMQMHVDSNDMSIVRATVDLGRNLNLRVVAEGVEDAATAHLLGEIGPLIGQGWHFGRPMAPPDLVAWIQARPDRD